jgi:F-type H+-transporting ATPase subunit a
MILAVNFFEHVLDTSHWHIFESMGIGFKLPQPFTKFIVLELIACAIIAFFYIRLARKIQDGSPARGWWSNALEAVAVFIRDEVAKPTLGEHDYDKFVPFLWTMFLFILVNNLLGLFPFMGSATGSLWVTGALAVCAFCVIHGAAIAKHGPVHYLATYFPHIEAPGGTLIAIFIGLMEIVGHFIKAFVLAVRLFANIFAGHTVLAVILTFVVLARNSPLFWPISFGSTLFIVTLSFLEIFIAFLQAYVFVYLASLFLGMTLHPEH